VGPGGVGKTSLVNRLLFDRFDRDEKKTDGIHIYEWRLRLPGSDDVRLNLWDFGGQEIMHATHQFFLSRRSLYLLVLEGRQSAADADAEYWLKLIESFGAESSGEVSPVLVAMNKIKYSLLI
jgi:internalin A